MKNTRLETKHQKYQGRIVLRGDIVKYDSGSYAVFTEQGYQQHKMTEAKVMDVISRLPGCAGQAADAASAETKEKWRMLQNYSKFPNRNVQTFGFVYHDTSGLNHGPVWKTQSFLLSGICTIFLWQDYNVKGNLRKSYCNTVFDKVSNFECLCVHREKGLILLVFVDDFKLAGKKQNIDPMWKVFNKEVDLREPTSFFDHENLGCTQRQSAISKDIVD